MNINYTMVIKWSDEDQCYLVHLPDFPFQEYHTHGDTYEEAAKHGREVIETYIEIYQEDGKELPLPKDILLDVA